MKTEPLATAGEDWNTGVPTDPLQSGWQVAAPHPAALKAYSLPSSEPTKTNPLLIVGVDSMLLPVLAVQSGWHVAAPHPFASNT